MVHPMLSINTILHPTDFSDHSRLAFDLACSMARQYGSRLILLHVAAPLLTVAAVPYDAVQAEEHSEEMLRAQLDELRSTAADVSVEYVLERGNPYQVILDVAGKRKSDMIVMGSHGRTGLSRFLMGSVAESVVSKAPCPVIVVKEPMPPETSG